MRLTLKVGSYYKERYDHKRNFNLFNFVLKELNKYSVAYTHINPSTLCCTQSLFIYSGYVRKSTQKLNGYINLTKWLAKELIDNNIITSETYQVTCCPDKPDIYVHSDIFHFKKIGKLNKWLYAKLGQLVMDVPDTCCVPKD